MILNKAVPYKNKINDGLRKELENLEKPVGEELAELEKSDEVKRYVEASAKLRHIRIGYELLAEYYGK